jgi:hypothetical protein
VTVWQTIGTFVGIPLAIILLITLAVYGKSLARQPNRYRPGRAWTYPPTWYVPHPDAVLQARDAAGSTATHTTAVGGASGEW